MAKPKTPTNPAPPKRQSHFAFRFEKLGQFLFQAYKVTLNDDGTFTEEKWDRVTLSSRIWQRAFQEMSWAAHQVFEAAKQIKKPNEAKEL
jgi:hypothetical protein